MAIHSSIPAWRIQVAKSQVQLSEFHFPALEIRIQWLLDILNHGRKEAMVERRYVVEEVQVRDMASQRGSSFS